MALNAFVQIATNIAKTAFAIGESKQGADSAGPGYKDWIEIQGWDWEVEAESSWTKGGGSSVGKPNPGKFNFEHYYDKSSNKLLMYICTGKAFPVVTLHMCKTTGAEQPQPYFKMEMTEAFITKVTNTATEEGNVSQKIELVFKTVRIDYLPQDRQGDDVGKLNSALSYTWNIPEAKSTA